MTKSPKIDYHRHAERGEPAIEHYKGYTIVFSLTQSHFGVAEDSGLYASSIAALKKKIDDATRVEYEPVAGIMLCDGSYTSRGCPAEAKLQNVAVVAVAVVEDGRRYRDSEQQVWVKRNGKREKVAAGNVLEATDECVAAIEQWRKLRIAADKADEEADAAYRALPRAPLPKPKTNPEVK